MTLTTTFPAVLLAVYSMGFAQSGASECKDWKACRELAMQAASRQDYDAFHDLAWRAVNTGPRNDPALMTLLARAQSLSGRPHDALVMLNRLAAMGVVTDAATSDDFARVRALPAWTDFEAKTAGIKPEPTPPAPAATPPAVPAPAAAPPAPKPAPDPNASKKDAAGAERPAAGKKPASATESAPRTTESPPALAFSSTGITTTGLAYDAVSGRFIVADGRDRRLLVLGERSGRIASLAGIDAGLGEITAIEIDAREGDLWVVSTLPASRASTLHKLQLISGRVLASIPLPSEQGASRFTDVAVTPLHVLVLDSDGRRVFRAAKKGKALDVAVRLAAADVVSLAPASDTIAYAAYDRGVIRLDLAARTVTVVEPGQPSVDLSGLTWMRWHRGGLVAVQKTADGSHRIVRIRLDDAGRTARAVDGLDDTLVPSGATSATIADNVLYFLSRAPDKDELTVKKITLK